MVGFEEIQESFIAVFILGVIVCLPTHPGLSSSLSTQSAQQNNSETKRLEIGHASKLQPVPQKPVELKVVSYNIRWRGGDDLRQLIRLLKDDREIGGAAIIALQEVDRDKKRTQNANTVKLIAEDLGLYYAWTAPPTVEGDGEEETGVAILSAYPLNDVKRIVLPHEGPGKRRRVAIGATVLVAKTVLRVYSVHSETRISVDKKIEQMSAVLADLGTNPKNMPTVIMGDLNTWEPSAVIRTHELFTKANFNTPFDNDTPTFFRSVVLFPIELKLDWIWLRGCEVSRHGIEKTINMSDHWPLWVVINLERSN